MKSLPLLMSGILIVPYMIHFRVNVWSKNMLSVSLSKKSCMIEVTFSIIESVSFFIQFTKGSKTK